MKIQAATIYDARTGFSNQLFILIHRILQARRMGTQLLVLDDFLLEVGNLERTCPIEEIIDLDHLNLMTYPLVILGKRQIDKISILDATYGTEKMRVPIHFPHLQSALRFEWNGNLHDLVEDPVFGHEKRLDILYRVGPRMILCSYPEGRSGHLQADIRIDLDRPSFSFEFGWINTICQEQFNVYLSMMAFIHLPLRPPPPFLKIHVLHLRLEEDAIIHWAPFNRMDTITFASILIKKYISILQKHILSQDGCLLILSSLTASPIHSFLDEHQYPYFQQTKPDGDGREMNALHDMLYAESCTGTLIINFHPGTLKGSSFSYVLMRRCISAERIILIDLDDIDHT